MEWQPIETAPKDGTEFLAYRRDADVFVVRWDSAVSFMTHSEIEKSGLSDDDLHDHDWFYSDFIQGGRLCQDPPFTHWMPLPPPPQT